MIDCLLVGYNDVDFGTYVGMIRAMGAASGAFRDLNLAFITDEGKPYRSMDVLNRFYRVAPGAPPPQFSNLDFFWPVITYLGTYLSRRGFSFDYINLFHEEKQRLADLLSRHEVRTVAITTTLYVSVEPILEIVSFIREIDPEVTIITGGPFVYNQAEMFDRATLISVFEYIDSDIYVISPEGESTLVAVLRALREATALSAIPNIAYRETGSFVMTRTEAETNPLAENREDFRLFPPDAFGAFLSIRTAKSCPFSCSFCGFPQRAGKYTYLDVENVERHLDAIRALGTVSTLTIIDDTFNVPKARFKDILRLMIRKQYGFRWNSYLRSDHVDEECVELMQQSGCEGVFLGIESGSNQMLKRMDKTSRREDYLRVIPQLREAGILTHGNLIVGFPGETAATVEESRQLIEAARPDFYRAQLWYCDPTTPVWHQRDTLGIQGSAFNWKHATMDWRTACDLVDRLFLDVESSIWLPQYGFELWSVFYLQRQGLSLAQIKKFLRCFNAAVRDKLQDPVRMDTSAARVASLRECCQPQ
jgi:anaerobic magnesium-protoporphyrin IX monomethyl ester cyclase